MNELVCILLIYAAVCLALIWSAYNSSIILDIKIEDVNDSNSEQTQLLQADKLQAIKTIGEKISNGSNAFLIAEYSVMTCFVVLFSIVVFFVVDYFGQKNPRIRFYATTAYIVGSATSMLCGYLGMRMAV